MFSNVKILIIVTFFTTQYKSECLKAIERTLLLIIVLYYIMHNVIVQDDI